MKYTKYIAGFVLGFVLLVPSVSSAATLTSFQINSIIGLLQAFNVDAVTIALVRSQLVVSTTTAQADIKPVETTPDILPIYQNNFFGSMTPPVQASAQPTPEADESAISIIQQTSPQLEKKDATNGIPFGTLQFQVRVFDENGATVDKAPVSMSVNGALVETRLIDTIYSPETKNDHYTSFQFIPQQSGKYVFSFVSGKLTKETSVTIYK